MRLLDVNVLLALAWPHHPFHAKATRYMANCGPWATCSATQLGFLRVSLNPAFVRFTVTPSEVLVLLARLIDDVRHRHLEGALAPLDVPQAFERVLGHRQVTDAYLIWFAKHHSARFLTLNAKLRAFPGVEVLT